MMNPTLKLILSILLPLAVGATSGFFTVTGVDSWYQTIQRPSWNPPNWIFGPVWTTLYLLMGIALFLVWRSDAAPADKRLALILFVVQLVLNFFWSIIFFGMQQPGWALLEMGALWLTIIATIFAFAPISRTAAWLLVPYICWVSFAFLLNGAIWRLNSGV